MISDRNYCHVVGTAVLRIQATYGLQRSFRGDGVAYFEADYLFGVGLSVHHESYEGRSRRCCWVRMIMSTTLLPQWAIKCSNYAGISSDHR